MENLDPRTRSQDFDRPSREEIEFMFRLQEWERLINNPDIKGPYYTKEGVWMIDRRYREDSPTYRLIGPRAIDLNIAGADRVPVPDDICAALGVAVPEAKQTSQNNVN